MNKESLEKLIKTAQTIHSRYTDYKSNYLESNNIISRVKESVNFMEGKHWAPATKLTKNMPRPVFPLVPLVVNTQISNILGSPYKLNYIAPNEDFASDIFTQFAQYQMKESQFEKVLEDVVYDSEVKGSGFVYLYWNEFARGKNGKYKGALRYEALDTLDIAVGDPTNEDIQEQEWIIYPTRISVKEARRMCNTLSEEQCKKLIQPDDIDTADNNYYDLNGLDSEKKVTVYTMFYRVRGEVVFVKATKNVCIVSETYQNPYKTKRKIENDLKKELTSEENENDLQYAKEDGSHSSTPDSDLEFKNASEDNYIFGLYPFEKLTTVSKTKSFIGLGTATNIVPNNKIVNFVMALNVMNIQNLAWGKILVKKGALKGQVLTNQPGQVVVDYTPGNGWGITNLPGQQTLSNGATEQVNNIVELTRSLNGSDEILTGEMLSSNLSGTAIAQIEAMRTKNVDRKQQRVWQFIERVGRIAYQFYVAYYKNESFTYEFKDDVFETLNKANPSKYPSKETYIDFNGEDFNNFDFDVSCEVGAGTRFSEISSMQLADNLLKGQYIDFDTYIEIYPDNQMPFKNKLRQLERKRQQSELEQWKNAYNQLKDVYEQTLQELSYNQQKAKSMESYADRLKKTYKDFADNKNAEITNMRNFMSNLPANSSESTTTENTNKNEIM